MYEVQDGVGRPALLHEALLVLGYLLVHLDKDPLLNQLLLNPLHYRYQGYGSAGVHSEHFLLGDIHQHIHLGLPWELPSTPVCVE